MAHVSYLLPLRATHLTLLAGLGLMLACSPKAQAPEPRASGPAASGAPASTGKAPTPVEPNIAEPGMLDPDAHFAPDKGWIELTPPLHLPSPGPAGDPVKVLARFTPSDRAQLKLISSKDGQRIAWPAGSELARLEYAGVGEARRLVGLALSRVGPAGGLVHQAATFWDGDELDTVHRPSPATACADCHRASRAANTTPNEHGLVDKGTDAQGFFTPQSVFGDLMPLESYGQHDRNLGNPFVGFGCSTNAPPVTRKPEGQARRVTCPTGIPVARYDIAKAMAAGDGWAAKVCASRAALHARMDDAARAHFAQAMTACAPATDSPGSNPEPKAP